MERTLASRGGMWRRLFASNVAAASATFVSGGLVERLIGNPFAAGSNLAIINFCDIPTSEKPGYASGHATPNSIMFQLFGTDDANETFSARIWGIERATGLVSTSQIETWKPTLLAEILATLSAAEGAAGLLVSANDHYVDTYAITSGAAQDIVINSNTDVRGSNFRIDNLAHQILAIEFDDGSSAAECNGLFRPLW